MRVLFVEPFATGSHAAFLHTLTRALQADHGVEPTVLAMPGRHWKWRMRGAVPWLAQEHDAALRARYDLVFATSYLALAELVGLYPHLGAVPRILYFHENQVAYPARAEFAGPRDDHFAWTQVVSALAATRCVFNSEHNRATFLDGSAALARRMPDARLSGWRAAVAARSTVLGVPLELPGVAPEPRPVGAGGPVLLWNHRWEHDKNPEECFAALEELRAGGVPFRLIVCGAPGGDVPPAMARARDVLADRIDHWGYCPDRAAYVELLLRADVVMSAARHEFFGVAVLEAVWCGARPLVPDRLAYPESIPAEYRYADLTLALRRLCTDPGAVLRADRRALVAPHRADRVVPRYAELFAALAR